MKVLMVSRTAPFKLVQDQRERTSAAERAGRNRPGAIAAVSFAIFGLLLVSCATQLEEPKVGRVEVGEERREQDKLALELLLERQMQVWKTGSRLRVAGADLCGKDVRYAFGFFAVDPATFGTRFQYVAPDLGIDPGVRIWDVQPGFPGGVSSLKRGDRITAIDAKAVSDFASFERSLAGPFQSGRLSMTLEAPGGGQKTVVLKGVLACKYPTAAIEGDVPNAYADGENVVVTIGMLRFVESDDELAVVIGHEIAHNALDHIDQRQAQAIAGALVDLALLIFAGVDTSGVFTQLSGMMFSKTMETDADYMGLYLAARGGYEIHGVVEFWRRLGAEYPSQIRKSFMSAHPSSPKRAATLRATIDEIEAKRSEGRPLIPKRRELWDRETE